MGRPRKPDPEKYCEMCGILLIRKVYGGVRLEDLSTFKKRKYCNQKCMGEAMEGTIKVENPKNYRRQSVKTRKGNCEKCGRGDSLLHVHHKDHNPMNNDPLNLTTLCGSCHRLCHSPNYTEMGEPNQPCRICGKQSARQQLCNTHLTRLKKHGDPLLKKVKQGSEWVLIRVDG